MANTACLTRYVLPASAGMILLLQPDTYVITRAPRIRGDDPETKEAAGSRVMCSPHPRG